MIINQYVDLIVERHEQCTGIDIGHDLVEYFFPVVTSFHQTRMCIVIL